MDTGAATAEAVTKFWSFLSMDTQTILSLIIGTLISLILFWVGYRKTIGAREERVNSANVQLINSVLRRVAVEREVMSSAQFEKLREAKAYRAAVSQKSLLSFESVTSQVLAEVIETDFLDAKSKNAIIIILEQGVSTATNYDASGDRMQKATYAKFLQVFVLAIISSLFGVLSITVAGILGVNPANNSAIMTSPVEVILGGISLITTIFAAYYSLKARPLLMQRVDATRSTSDPDK